jgi:hypothetical protein
MNQNQNAKRAKNWVQVFVFFSWMLSCFSVRGTLAAIFIPLPIHPRDLGVAIL